MRAFWSGLRDSCRPSLRLLAAALLAPSIVGAVEPETVLYIRAEFNDRPFGVSDATNLQRLQTINAVAEDFWVFNSYGELSEFQSDYTEMFQLPDALTPDSPFESGANVFAIRSAMRDAAANAGWALNNYDQVVLSFPGVDQFPAGALGTPGTIWMPSDNPNADGFTHEFGHALGVGHASAIEGGAQTYPGEHREGRDGLWMMGSENGVAAVSGRPRRAPVNLPMRQTMGFVDDQLVQQVTEDGVFRIHAFDRESLQGDVELNRSLAAVFESDNREWWVSFAPSLADRWADFNGHVWTDGAIVQQRSGQITRILDFTPASQGGTGNEEDYVDTRDGALRVGMSYSFPENGVSLATLANGVSNDGVPWIDVQISFGFAPLLPGDLNGDDLIDSVDLLTLTGNLFTDVSTLTYQQSYPLGDINGDAKIDYTDIQLLKNAHQRFINSISAPPLPTPEPSSVVLVMLGLAVCPPRRGH